MTQGRFITFEGGEGAGKTTQIKLLAERLRLADRTVLTTREPGGATGAEEVRKLLVEGQPDRWDPVTEVLLHVAARHDHLLRTIRPALERGEWVLSDRFADSTMAYQGYGLGVPGDTIDRIHEAAIGRFAPDLTLVLDLPVETGLARARDRGGEDRYERMGLDFHHRLRDGFLAIAAGAPERCVVVDADRPVQMIADDVAAVVAARLPLNEPRPRPDQ